MGRGSWTQVEDGSFAYSLAELFGTTIWQPGESCLAVDVTLLRCG